MLRLSVASLSVVLLFCAEWYVTSSSAQAKPPFKRYFNEKYFPAEGDTPMKKAYGVGSCNFCHVGGAEDRKYRNAYGKAINKFINAADAAALSPLMKGAPAFKMAEEKVRSALDAVAREKSNAADRNSPTFGELLEQGRLPKSATTLPRQ